MRKSLRRFLERLALTFIGLGLLSLIFKDSIQYASLLSLAVASFLLTFLYNTLRPVLVVISLPLIVVSFGIFFALINAFLIFITDKISPGFNVNGFWYAILAGLVAGLVNYYVDRRWFKDKS
jgi:putative membrane protein